MVCASVRQGKEEDLQRSGPNHTGKEAQDVQLSGMEGPKNCIQEVCTFLFLITFKKKLFILAYPDILLTWILKTVSGLDMPAFISAVLWRIRITS